MRMGITESDYNGFFSTENNGESDSLNVGESLQPDEASNASNVSSHPSNVSSNASDESSDATQRIDSPTDLLNLIEMNRLILKKIDAMENYVIKLNIKIDNLRDQELTMPNTPAEIDIALLNEMGLPAESASELNKLEKSLRKSAEFKAKLVSIVESISGTGGNSNGFKVLEKIVFSLISPQFLPGISWTGRGKGNEKKFAMSALVHTMNLIVLSVCKADKNYDSDKVLKKFKYTILKTAPSKFGQKMQKDSSEMSSTLVTTES